VCGPTAAPHTSSGSSGSSFRRRLQVTRAAPSSAAAAATQQQQQLQELRGKDVVMRFYEAYNERDLDTIASLIADDIAYHDLVYEEPHEGREGVMDWLNKVGGSGARNQ
jgi:ABC-type microcin C transport system duplicated ATPase subunit YejF